MEPVVTLTRLSVGSEYGHMIKLGLGPPATPVLHEIKKLKWRNLRHTFIEKMAVKGCIMDLIA